MNHDTSADTLSDNEAISAQGRIMGAPKESSNRIFLYFLLLTAFWVFTFLTLNCWLKPYSIAHEQNRESFFYEPARKCMTAGTACNKQKNAQARRNRYIQQKPGYSGFLLSNPAGQMLLRNFA